MNYIGLLLIAFLVSCQAEGEKKKEDENVLKYKRPEVSGFAYIAEPFHEKSEFDQHWIASQAKKDDVDTAISKYDGQWAIEEASENPLTGDQGLVLKTQAKHHAIATLLPTKFEFKDQPLILQYEVKFQNALECGGAYVKLLSDSPDLDLEQFTDKTGYTIMFGPDKCGESSKLHFIFRHKNPMTGKFEEKHAKKPTGEFSKIFDDKKTHLVTLVVRPDGSFDILVDKTSVNSGNLLTDMDPPVNPPQEIDDPNDKKPDDWDEREKIPDANAKKPDDWDEDAPKQIPDANAKKPEGWLDDAPEYVPDPNAKKPADWDDEEDGEWEAPQIQNPACTDVGCGEWKPPLIDNPNYKGKWTPPMINNPNYKGIWKPKRIPNPDFFEDKEPFKMTPIGALGFELWSMTSDILFDNIILTSDQAVVDQWTADTWDLKRTKEFETLSSSEGGVWNQLMEATHERPWLWILYAAVVFLPFVLIAAFCFPSKKDKTAERKKTDEPTPDDEPESKEEGKEDEEQAGESKDDAEEEKKEGNEEEEEAEEDSNKNEEETKEEEGNQEKDAKGDTEETKTEERDDAPLDASPRTRAARRRLRKDT